MKLKKELKLNPNLFEQLINIYLVIKKVRTAFLLETVHIKKEKKERLKDVNYLLQLSIDNNLVYIELEGDYLIANAEEMAKYLQYEDTYNKNIGRILGFYCWDHTNFHDTTKNRIGCDIYVNDIVVYAEICEKDKVEEKELIQHLRKLSENIQKALGDKFNVTYKTEYMMSNTFRIEAMSKGDVKFILENIEDYKNDIFNYWTDDENGYLYQNFEKLVTQHLEIVQYIWKKFIVSSKLTEQFLKKYDGEEINKLISKFDKNIFSEDINTLSIDTIRKKWKKFKEKYLDSFIS